MSSPLDVRTRRERAALERCARQSLDPGQIGVELGAFVRREAAADFGEREAQQEGAEQSLDARHVGIGDAGVAQPGVERGAPRDGGGRRERAAQEKAERLGVAPRSRAHPLGQRGQALGPGKGGVGHPEFVEQALDDPVEQPLLVADVPVERHRGDLKTSGDRPHTDGVQAVAVGDRQGGVEDRAIERSHSRSIRRILAAMRLLLGDGSSLTARQVATQAAAAGHRVEVLSASRIGLACLTGAVDRVHRVPAFGQQPRAWLDTVLAVLRRGGHDVLVPTQEHVALLSREAPRIRALGVGLAVPPFEALMRVQDKVAQAATVDALGLPAPQTSVVWSANELVGVARLPVFVKEAIGTASRGVRRLDRPESLRELAFELDARRAFVDGVVVQEPADGRLCMVQAVFGLGKLVAWHACVRAREGLDGGASVKRSVGGEGIEQILTELGGALGWHGALSLDVILTAAGPRLIDVNPRLVEPGNAWRAGIDLVDALLRVACGASVGTGGPGAPGVVTYQLLLALFAAAGDGGRRAVASELVMRARRLGPYAHGEEELTPWRGDPLAAVPLLAAAAAGLIAPGAATGLAAGAVNAYAMTSATWRWIAG